MTISTFHWGAARARVVEGRLTGLAPFERDRNPSGLLAGAQESVYSELRIREPMVRASWLRRVAGVDHRLRRGSDGYVAVSWPQALDLAANAITETIDSRGNRAIYAGSYGWASAGRLHHAPSLLHRLFNCVGGSVQHLQTYSYAAAQVICPHVVGSNDCVFGGTTTTWPSIRAHTQRFFLFGGLNVRNAQVNAGGVLTHETELRVADLARKEGFRLYSISPIRDDTPAAMGAQWVPIRPGTDTALMLGIAHVLIDEGLADLDFLASHTVGYERLRDYILGTDDGTPKTPHWAAAITGIDAQTIAELAQQMARHRSLLTGTWSLQRADHGEQPYWMMIALAAMLGQVGLPGGGVCFGYGSTGNRGEPRSPFGAPRMEEGENPVDLRIPVARVADMLLEPGKAVSFNGRQITYPEIDLVYWAGGNPFHHHQDLNRLVRAFARPQTVIVNEIYWTATARRADIVFPATTALERNDLAASSSDNHLMAAKRQIEPVGQARDDFDIFLGLAQRLGVEQAFSLGLDEAGWLRRLYGRFSERCARGGHTLPDFDQFWAGEVLPMPGAREQYDLFAEFRSDAAAHPLATPSGRIELWSQTIADFGYPGFPAHPAWLEPQEWLGKAAHDELHLISNQPATRLHAQLDPFGVSRESKHRGREPLRLHPADAAQRGLAAGDIVRIHNARGACLAALLLDDALLPGVAQLATGAWFDPLEPGVPDSLEVHGNPNVLTSNRATSPLSQAPAHHSTLVRIERYTGELPPITVHALPSIVAG